MNKPLVLVVEDDRPVRNLIVTTLKAHDYRYLTAENGHSAIIEATSHNPDIVLLDLGLPDIDGTQVIESIRSWSNMPIIVISARSEDKDKITALDAGADDYLTKPFSVEELLARLRVTQRRLLLLQASGDADSPVFQNGKLKIDYAAGCAYLNGEELHLTPIEYKLLCLLSHNVGKVLTHTYITQQIWGSSWENDIASLRVFMATLRKKLEPQKDSPQYIQTHIGLQGRNDAFCLIITQARIDKGDRIAGSDIQRVETFFVRHGSVKRILHQNIYQFQRIAIGISHVTSYFYPLLGITCCGDDEEQESDDRMYFHIRPFLFICLMLQK